MKKLTVQCRANKQVVLLESSSNNAANLVTIVGRFLNPEEAHTYLAVNGYRRTSPLRADRLSGEYEQSGNLTKPVV